MAKSITALFARSGPVEDNAMPIRAGGWGGSRLPGGLINGATRPAVGSAASANIVVTRIAVASEIAYTDVDSISAQVAEQILTRRHIAMRGPLERSCLVYHWMPAIA